jgi:hypothetical protein
VEEVYEVMTMGIDKTTTIELEKDRMVTNISRHVQSLKLDIIRLHGIMEKMKNMEPYYFYHML